MAPADSSRSKATQLMVSVRFGATAPQWASDAHSRCYRLLLLITGAVIAATFTVSEASARHGHKVVVVRHVGGVAGWSAADFCGGQLPAYGTDACGHREFSYGPGSCWRRAVVYTALGP